VGNEVKEVVVKLEHARSIFGPITGVGGKHRKDPSAGPITGQSTGSAGN
jgi:hypothetical protein